MLQTHILMHKYALGIISYQFLEKLIKDITFNFFHYILVKSSYFAYSICNVIWWLLCDILQACNGTCLLIPFAVDTLSKSPLPTPCHSECDASDTLRNAQSPCC